MMAHHVLAGRRVLVVEDELLIAMLVESALEEEGCVVVGPYGRLAEAVAAARDEAVDVAVLDINLGGEMVFPAAEVLAERNVPFLLLTGYGDAGLPPHRRHWPVCGKPFSLPALIGILSGLVEHA